MATISQDLGVVTAYAYAVAGGYTGTETEFRELLGNIAEDLREIENLTVTVTTLAEGSSATASYSHGVLSLGIPRGNTGTAATVAVGTTTTLPEGSSATVNNSGTSGAAVLNFGIPKGDTGTAATIAVGSVTTLAPGSDATVTNSGTSGAAVLNFGIPRGAVGEVSEAELAAAIAPLATTASVEAGLAAKANTDGAYESMTVGNAEQLVSTVMVTDKAPYLFRTSGGSADIGNREYDTLVGGSVAWNQLADTNFLNVQFAYANCTPSFSDGIFTMTATASGVSQAADRSFDSLIADHTYLVGLYARADSDNVRFGLSFNVASINTNKVFETFVTQEWVRYYGIGKFSDTSYKAFRIGTFSAYSLPVDGKLQIKSDIVICDLTQMFGIAIADYAYTLESGTAGAGVAWLKSYGFFAEPYYTYNAGTMLHTNASAHETTGFNQYNPSTGTAELLGGREYQITGAYSALSYSTGETITPDSGGLFTPAANGTLTITGGDSTTTCVHLTWSGYRNGEFEQFVKHSYPLDSDLTLRGIPTLVDGQIQYVGDVYHADGTVDRNMGIVDLGTLDWTYDSASILFYTTQLTDGIANENNYIHCICEKYTTVKGYGGTNGINNTSLDNVISVGSSYISLQANLLIRDTDYTDAATFKAAMSGVYLVYELASPTTENADAFQSPQIVDDFGTERYVVTAQSGVEVPVGHSTDYPANLRDKLQHLPDLAENDGTYLIQQTDNDMALTPYAAPRGVPDAPTTDGTYVLKATVADGTATYQWVSE